MINTVTNIYNDDNELMCYQITYVNSDKVIVCPINESNRHYQEVLQWVADGNEIGEPE